MSKSRVQTREVHFSFSNNIGTSSLSLIMDRSLFNLNSPAASFLFPSLLYSAPLLFQSDPSFRLYHEAFCRTFFDQYSQSNLPLPAPIASLNVVPSVPTESSTSNASTSESSQQLTSSMSSTAPHGKVRRRLSCPQCAYTTNRLNNLKRHIQTMHEILSEPIECCDQLFTSKANFRTHVNAEHRCGYHCDTCRRTFCRKALLRRHQSIHSGQKAFVCHICSYSTSHKGNLDRHARVHRHHHDAKSSSNE